MHKSPLDKRRERLSNLQENVAITSMGVMVVSFALLMMGAMVQWDALAWAGVAGMFASPILACVALVIDTINT